MEGGKANAAIDPTLCVVVGLVCANRDSSTKHRPALRAKIEGLQRQYSEAFHKADAASVASRYADDGILVTPFSTISGKSAIEKNYVDLFKQGWNTEQTTLDEVLPPRCRSSGHRPIHTFGAGAEWRRLATQGSVDFCL
jgi:hypothetical protein